MSRLNANLLRSRRAWMLLLPALGIGAAWSTPAVFADLTAPQSAERTITMAVVQKLQADHLSHHRLDDEMSERWLKNYVKVLDPLKLYFTQADIDEFNQHKDDLDDWAKRGDINYGHHVFKRFLQRVEERVKMADELVKEKHDFSVDETFIIEPDEATYAKDDAAVHDLWRRRVKYDLLGLMAEKAKVKAAADAKEAAGKETDGKDKPGKDDQAGSSDAPTLSVDEPSSNDKPAKPATDKPSASKLARDKEADLPPEEKLSRRYHSFLKRWRRTDNSELLALYLTSLATAYDPHTSYMSPDELNDFEIQMRLNLEGIGAALKETQEGTTVIQKIIPGGAADKDGRLKRDDKVVGVGQEKGEIVDITDMKLRDVVKLIRGERGTIVRLKVLPDGDPEPKIYNITRAQVELTDSEARSEILELDRKPNGTPYKIGFIDLPSFYMDMEAYREGDENYKSCTRDVARLIEEFIKQKVDVVVLDLRHNGGGSLTESINLTGLFIETGPVVQVKDSDKHVQSYNDPDREMMWKGPLVVLTSKLSASASEIFAGAIQDYRRGLIVGDPSTHGKGTVQSLADIGHDLYHLPHGPKLGALKVTIQQFYRPNGDSTQNRGVLADVDLPSIISQLDIGESSYDYALKFDHVPQVLYRSYDKVNSELVRSLKSNSTKRCAQSKDFTKLAKTIDRFNQQKNRKSISLDEKVFLAERAEINADKEEEKEMEELNDPNRPVFDKDNYYSQEVMAVTLDYLRAFQGLPAAATVGQSDRAPVPAR
jgi:carboxyl-terminal processing protease